MKMNATSKKRGKESAMPSKSTSRKIEKLAVKTSQNSKEIALILELAKIAKNAERKNNVDDQNASNSYSLPEIPTLHA